MTSSSGLYLVFSAETCEYALPHRMGWTRILGKAGLYDERRGEKACETMLDGERWATSLIPIDLGSVQ